MLPYRQVEQRANARQMYCDDLCRDRPEAVDRCCEVAAPIFPLDDRPYAMIVGSRLSHGRIKAAQASVLLRLLRSSLALIVEELAITASARGHWMPPSAGCWVARSAALRNLASYTQVYQPGVELSQGKRRFAAGAGRDLAELP